MSFFQLTFLLFSLSLQFFLKRQPISLETLVNRLVELDSTLLIEGTVAIVVLLSFENLEALFYHIDL